MMGGPREPIYLASQLASICDVDLKTIHNWCDRNYGDDPGGQLECFRTPGGHLRFRHTSVLRFLRRWGYPIPDALLRDRPHLVLVDADVSRRTKLLQSLDLVRPGESTDSLIAAQNAANTTSAANGTSHHPAHAPHEDGTTGLFCNSRWYVHVWDDPYAAVVAIGERAAGGGEIDLALLALPMPDLDPVVWVRTVRARDATREMFIALLAPEDGVVAAETAAAANTVVTGSPNVFLEQQGARWASVREKANERGSARRRRVAIAPREPIYVASQVASIWNVDLKTVHNWVERGDIEAFCTPGRHLRFRRRSLLHFLRRYNMALPEELVSEKPRVMIIDPDARAARRLAGVLGDVFQTTVHQDVVAALAEIGAQCSGAGMIDAVVVTLPLEGIDGRRWIQALTRHPDTRYTRIVVLSSSDAHRKEWQELGAIAASQSSSLEQVGTVLERALGMGN